MKNFFGKKHVVRLLCANFIFSIALTLMFVFVSDSLLFKLMSVLYVLLGILAFVCTIRNVSAYRRYKKSEIMSHKRLMLIRQVIDLAYVHSNNKELLYKKICNLVNINNLRELGIMEFPEASDPITGNDQSPGLDKSDYEFYFMLNNGFTPRELSVIYNYTNPTSIYVKKHRLKNKIGDNVGMHGGLQSNNAL